MSRLSLLMSVIPLSVRTETIVLLKHMLRNNHSTANCLFQNVKKDETHASRIIILLLKYSMIKFTNQISVNKLKGE